MSVQKFSTNGMHVQCNFGIGFTCFASVNIAYSHLNGGLNYWWSSLICSHPKQKALDTLYPLALKGMLFEENTAVNFQSRRTEVITLDSRIIPIKNAKDKALVPYHADLQHFNTSPGCLCVWGGLKWTVAEDVWMYFPITKSSMKWQGFDFHCCSNTGKKNT